ncbi:hypothetical protein RA11412_1616 [Rothia aeria]|uniref:Uncharacterized protein n=1 Tax=Rothia aeria TaxID=172042 RepID=A0A2Z5QZJ2_9MICC|nr:hypothetical protein RA11412_1616 [Rothia aeria]
MGFFGGVMVSLFVGVPGQARPVLRTVRVRVLCLKYADIR